MVKYTQIEDDLGLDANQVILGASLALSIPRVLLT